MGRRNTSNTETGTETGRERERERGRRPRNCLCYFGIGEISRYAAKSALRAGRKGFLPVPVS
ncbi:MAG TPA: hypothetical protein VK628_01220, partial [Flavitalea sp.]|nr:hypothetical protein [Flavitalea sp.]